jgi:hypothetical protein
MATPICDTPTDVQVHNDYSDGNIENLKNYVNTCLKDLNNIYDNIPGKSKK